MHYGKVLMAMVEDFFNAHERHWDDAEFLYQKQRWANADHLYGLSAECGLKWLMEKFQNASIASSQKKHVNHAWVLYETCRNGHGIGAQFVLPQQNPFQNWDISDRYADQKLFSEAITNSHKSGAKLIVDLVQKAFLEGMT